MTTFDTTRHPPKANNYPGNVVSFWENSLLRELCDKCDVWMDAPVRKMLAVLSIITPHSALRIQAWCVCVIAAMGLPTVLQQGSYAF
ncbi:UNVERIFIED_CONTAM: hypothetical protein FKN15_010860 [Acipenser sinensis]